MQKSLVALVSLVLTLFSKPERSNSGVYHRTAAGKIIWSGFAKGIFVNDPNFHPHKLKKW